MTNKEKKSAQKKEMINFMSYFKNHKLDFSDQKRLKIMQDEITKIVQLEIEDLGINYDPEKQDSENEFLLKFINNPCYKEKGSYRIVANVQNGELVEEKPELYYNIAYLYEDLESDDEETRLLACKILFSEVFHEIQHYNQERMTRLGVSCNEALLYARDIALDLYLENPWYSIDGKTGNYEQCAVESNASEVGYNKYLEIMGTEDRIISSLRDIESGKFHISWYKANLCSRDNRFNYNFGKRQQREDITIPILDHALSEGGMTALLIAYPILQKEYNLDGTKKTAKELVENMKQEFQELSQNTNLSEEVRQKQMKDMKEMYYELIYRQVKKSTPEQISELSNEIDAKNILEQIQNYYHEELKNKLEKLVNMVLAMERLGRFEYGIKLNEGTIAVKQNGQSIDMDFSEFIKTIDSNLLEDNIIVQSDDKTAEISTARFIEKYCFDYLAESGIMILKDETQLTAKDFVEQYILQNKIITKDNTPKKIIKSNVDIAMTLYKQNGDKLVSDYFNKKNVLINAKNQILMQNVQQRENLR